MICVGLFGITGSLSEECGLSEEEDQGGERVPGGRPESSLRVQGLLLCCEFTLWLHLMKAQNNIQSLCCREPNG